MDTAMRDFWFFILLLIALWVLWVVGGGPERNNSQSGPFLRPPQPLDTGESYGGPEDIYLREASEENGSR